jgi:hypothetical protein
VVVGEVDTLRLCETVRSNLLLEGAISLAGVAIVAVILL